jgi:hypothetical protein
MTFRIDGRALGVMVSGVLVVAVSAIAQCWISLGWISLAEAQSSSPSSKVAPAEFPPISRDQMDTFLDSVRSSVQFDLSSPKESQRIDPNIAGIWAGSSTRIETDIRQVTLRFRRKVDEVIAASQTEGYDANHLLDQFDFSIDPGERWMVFQHSNAELRGDADGFRFRSDKPSRETRSPFIRGQKESSLYLAIPPYKDPTKTWGILVCPRRIGKKTGSGGLIEYALSQSPYELSEVFLSYSARADATMSTAGQDGLVKLTLQVSKSLPETSHPSDEAVSSVPQASLTYKPQTPIDFFRFAPFDKVQEGGLFEVAMVNKAGYERKQFYSHALYVEKFLEPPPTTVVADAHRVSSDTGECYVVLDFRYAWTEYLKGPVPSFSK